MGEALVTLPDGRKAKVTFTDRAQLDATVADLTKGAPGGKTAAPQAAPPKTAAEAPGAAQTPTLGERAQQMGERLDGAVFGAPEAALKVGSGLVSSAAGGVAGLARGAGAGAASLMQGEGLAKAGQAFSDEAAGTIEGVGQAATYQPRTQGGQDAATVVEAPFKLLAAGADVAGRKTAEVTGSPALGAAVNTVIQSAPSALGLKAGRLGAGAEGAEAAAGASRGTAGGAAASRAEAYAGNLGLNWSRLAPAIKENLTKIASDAKNLEKLDPEAVKRQALLQGLRVPVETTRAKLTRNSADLRREAVASKTDAGQPIRDTDIRANRDIQANLEALRGRKAGQRGGLHDPTEEGAAQTPSVRAATKGSEDVGRSVQSSIRAKAKQSKANYDALYKKARDTDPTSTVPDAPLKDLLKNNPDIQHLGFVQGWLSKAEGAAKAGGRPEGQYTLAELHDLREKAGELAAARDTPGHYAGQVKKTIDKMMMDVPEGAKAWKQAAKAFQKHQAEFKDQSVIKKLVSNKGGDRALALEKTAQTIAKGSLEQIRQVKKSLLTQEGPRQSRFEGRRAWRDLQGETVNRILEDARNVVATDEAERQVLTAAALRKSINSVGRDRLTEIIGKNSTDELYRILRAAKITRTEPAGRVTESGTVPNALVLAEKHLAHLVPGGNLARGIKEGLSTLKARGAAARDTQEALKTPLQAAAEESERRTQERITARRRHATTLRAGAALAPGVGENARRPAAPE